MKLSAMRYKGFTWPNNPHTVQVQHQKEIKQFFLPYAGETAQNYGQKARMVECEGEFYGNTAFSTFVQLANLFKQKQAGQLLLPGMEPFFAHFKSLEILGKPGPVIIDYRCSFLEEPTLQLVTRLNVSSCAAGENDTLWDIAARYGVSLEKLLTLNPSIRDPFSVRAGQAVLLQ